MLFLLVSVILSLMPINTEASASCGDYYKLKPREVGYIYNPEYPKPANVNLYCVWYLEAPPLFRIKFQLSFVGERYNKTCSDYVQIRDGGKYSPLLGEYCDAVSNTSVTSSNSWLRVTLKTDFINGSSTRLASMFWVYFNKTPPENNTKPVADCRSYEFECRNKDCLSMSYRCDGHNDCGCTFDCDENGCSRLTIDRTIQFVVGSSVGAGLFLIICILTCMIEGQSNWIASRAEELRIRENQAEERRKKAFKAFTKFIGEKEVV